MSIGPKLATPKAAIGPWLNPASPEQNGGLPVVVEYTSSCARCAVQLGEAWRVRPAQDLLTSVAAQLGSQRVAVEY